MKFKTLLSCTLIMFSLHVQSQGYDFNVTTGSYSSLVGSISLNNGYTWDDPQFTIPVGFNFKYFDTVLNVLYLDDWGYGGELSADTSEIGIYAVLTPYGADIADRGYDVQNDIPALGSLSNISYLLEGNPGSRVLKIEWENVGFYTEILNHETSLDFTNFQLWLYEGSNNIEIHFGPNSINYPALSFDYETGSFIGLFPHLDFVGGDVIGNGIALDGSPSSPSALTAYKYYDNFLDGVIPNGTIYRFNKIASGIPDLNNELIEIYPNPANDNVSILNMDPEIELYTISIIDASGQIAKEINYNANSVDVSDLNTGLYFVKLISKKDIIIKKLMIN